MNKNLLIRLEHAVIGMFVFLTYAYHIGHWGWYLFWLIIPFAVGFGVFFIDKDRHQPAWKFLLHDSMFTYITPLLVYILLHSFTSGAWSVLAGWVTAVAIYRLLNIQYMEKRRP